MRIHAIFFLLCLVAPLGAAEDEYSKDISTWLEIPVPPPSDREARWQWLHAANHARVEWRVFILDGQPRAERTTEPPATTALRPPFTPKAAPFEASPKTYPTDDGWLVGFNDGEFGAALYWFSQDGARRYKISDHQVVDFFEKPDGVYAIEGSAHTDSRGSIIRIIRPKATARWEARTVIKLPFAPFAVSVRRDGTMLVTLSRGLVAVDNEGKISTLIPDLLWGFLSPNSSILSSDEKQLFIGMRRYVAIFDLQAKSLRFLVPSESFLDK